MKQPATVREAGSMLKERWLDRRVEKLARENDELREELQELKHDLDAEQGRTKDTLDALSKARRPGRFKWLVLAGGAYVLGTKAGRARYEQMKGWVRSMQDGGNGSVGSETPSTTSSTTSSTPASTTPSTTGSGTARGADTSGTKSGLDRP